MARTGGKELAWDNRASEAGVAFVDPLFVPGAQAAVRRHPRFRQTAEAISRTAIALHEGLDPSARWMLKDVGRTAVYVAIVILDSLPFGVTPGQLAKICLANGACSRARALAFVSHGLATRHLVLSPGPQSWTKRRLIPQPAFRDILRGILAGLMESGLAIAPELSDAIPLLADDRHFAVSAAALGQIATQAARLGISPIPAIEFFAERDGGLRMLQYLAGRQEPLRARLLDTAQMFKTDVARRCGVSRIHLDTVLADAAQAGLLSMPTPDRVVFAPALDEAFGRWVILQIQSLRYLARAMRAAAT